MRDDSTTDDRCPNCSYQLRSSDRYCPACGQGVAVGRDRSLANLLRASLAEVTSIDGRLWRSLKCLMLRPGLLSREHRQGRRRRYLSPISLFLLGNLLYFIAPPLSDLQLSLVEQYEMQPYSPWIAAWVDGYVAESGQSFESVAARYQLRIVELAKLMVIVHVPLIALGTMLLFADKRLYYADHVVMVLHYFAFLMIYLIAASALLGLLWLVLPGASPVTMPGLKTVAVLLPLLYVPIMLRTALGVSWWRAVVSVPLFVAILLAAHFTYRLVQFLIGFASVALR
jgi:hypothetical protein